MTASSPGATTGTHQPSARRIIAAACIGNALEWYDIAVYSYFAVYIARVYFSNDDSSVSLLLALGTFGVAFLVRPFGGMFFGPLSDRIGRTKVLSATVILSRPADCLRSSPSRLAAACAKPSKGRPWAWIFAAPGVAGSGTRSHPMPNSSRPAEATSSVFVIFASSAGGRRGWRSLADPEAPVGV